MYCVCRLYQRQKYLPIMFVGDLNNRIKDLVVSMIFQLLSEKKTKSILSLF